VSGLISFLFPKPKPSGKMSAQNGVGAVEGYPSLAKFMGPRHFGIFRKFAELNTTNILHLQSELAFLEKELEVLSKWDNAGGSGDPRSILFAQSARALRTLVETGNDRQWQKLLEIRGKLKEYSKD
jgi:hypothetical protein